MAIMMRVAEPGSRGTVSQEPEMRAMATRVIRTGAAKGHKDESHKSQGHKDGIARVRRSRVTRARVIRMESQGP